MPPAKSEQGKPNWLGAIPVDWRVRHHFLLLGNRISRLKTSYLLATLRNVTPVDCVAGEIGLGFNVSGKEPIRFRLGLTDAKALLSVVQRFLIESHSDKSSGIQSFDVLEIPGAEEV